ncbi:MAG: hypothetical protein ABIJ26_06030 [Candidatus Margulisiibacteriota bacterium]
MNQFKANLSSKRQDNKVFDGYYGVKVHYDTDAPKRVGISYHTRESFTARFQDAEPGIDPIAVTTEMLEEKGAVVIGNITINKWTYLLIDAQSYENVLNTYDKEKREDKRQREEMWAALPKEEQDAMDPARAHIVYGRDNGWPK